jgi:hypothetical protein
MKLELNKGLIEEVLEPTSTSQTPHLILNSNRLDDSLSNWFDSLENIGISMFPKFPSNQNEQGVKTLSKTLWGAPISPPSLGKILPEESSGVKAAIWIL